jgi:hypothetical protein
MQQQFKICFYYKVSLALLHSNTRVLVFWIHASHANIVPFIRHTHITYVAPLQTGAEQFTIQLVRGTEGDNSPRGMALGKESMVDDMEEMRVSVHLQQRPGAEESFVYGFLNLLTFYGP